MMTFRIYYNSKSVSLIRSVVKTEQMNVTIKTCVDAIGDTIIEVRGERDEIKILKEIYEMIA